MPNGLGLDIIEGLNTAIDEYQQAQDRKRRIAQERDLQTRQQRLDELTMRKTLADIKADERRFQREQEKEMADWSAAQEEAARGFTAEQLTGHLGEEELQKLPPALLESGQRFQLGELEKTYPEVFGAGKPTKAQESIDRAFGKDYQKWVVGGGFADAMKGLTQLQDAVTSLEAERPTGLFRGTLQKVGLGALDPKLAEIRAGVEEVVQRNLRLILGAQFTQREGERLIERAFDPQLPPSQNIKRVNRLIRQIALAAEAKRDAVQYFNEHGTLRGYQGRLYTEEDFENLTDGTGTAAGEDIKKGLNESERRRKAELEAKLRAWQDAQTQQGGGQ